MRVIGSSLGAWRLLERQEGIKVPHGIVFSLATLEAIGRPHGLSMVAEEDVPAGTTRGYDAVFISVLDTRCVLNAAAHFARWEVPLRRSDRAAGKWPLIWAGGQGLNNPRPLAPIADLIVIGDAEDPLPALLRLWHEHSKAERFLSLAATVGGVYVPAVHDPETDTVVQSVATDVGVTLRTPISVSHDGTRRIEIARGCRYKCSFCSLGWRAPVRENDPEEVCAEIERSPKRVHLQAGDAESHSGIDQIRATLATHGGSDQGWTGRLDSLFENPDQMVPGQKRYAFGVEGVSHRLRKGVGKGYLTDERLISDTLRFFERIEGDGAGRAAWHLIAGLPTEREPEALQLVRVIREIDARRQGTIRRNLALHWQPFQPVPYTPMQWCASGHGARRRADLLRAAEGLGSVRVRQLTGRTDQMAALCAVLARADERGADLIEAAGRGRVRPKEAEEMTGSTAASIDPDAPLPWDFIERPYPKAVLRKAFDVMKARLS